MSAVMQEQAAQDTETSVLERFESYPFATDAEYQEGLSGILSSGVLEGKSEEEKADIFLRSEVFYFNRRTGSSISMEEARIARKRKALGEQSNPVVPPSASQSSNGDSAPEPQMLSLAQLKALIEQGRTDEIPNNKIIPNVLSTEAPSESKAAPRKKPWEVNASA
ncbi:hypothetical protein ONZ51_g5735 [Trametes cubensis]|uniref:Uncharacterized protein n=1 Tax=Trametes cubensis TaxID=1111947 RepID=A0AAD7TTG4_9APHY|nr:hypothetical protein ONZ51_g5735 [Trametes cubensis]